MADLERSERGDQPLVASVILTHNSQDCFVECLKNVYAQASVDQKIIVVDNASELSARQTMIDDFLTVFPDGHISDVQVTPSPTVLKNRAVFVCSSTNGGYSTGNNIGARLGVASGCKAVLFVNPDVQIEDPDYLSTLTREMFETKDCMVAVSRITDLSGRDENPLREPGFAEELLWVRQLFPRLFGQSSYVVPFDGNTPRTIEKAHGCCMLVSAVALENIGYLDEGVFLYCEEAILSAKVRKLGGKILFCPDLHALHAHAPSHKAASHLRMRHFIRSRMYYIERYSGYSKAMIFSLRFSYRLLLMAHKIRSYWSPVRIVDVSGTETP